MKKKFALALVLAAAGGAFLFGAGSSSILSPKPPAPQPQAQSPASAHAKVAPRKDGLLQVRGRILKVYPADKARKTAEWIVILAGKRRVSILVYGSAGITDRKGASLKPAFLKAGEIVSVSYRHNGKRNTALTIRA
jgi:hypothetical protein